MPATSPAAKARFKAYAKAWAADRYAQRKTEGKCTTCAKPRDDDGLECSECRSSRKLREINKSNEQNK